MAIALDANMLILLFDERAAAATDPAAGRPATQCQDRLSHFLGVYGRPKGARIVVPTPAFAEFLVKVDPARKAEHANKIQRIRGCLVAPFSVRAAIGLSDMQGAVLAEVGRRRRRRRGPRPSSTSRSSPSLAARA